MRKVALFDTKPYDKEYFDAVNAKQTAPYEMVYFENKLTAQTAQLAKGCEAVCAFVNDDISKEAIETLYGAGVKVLAMPDIAM